jgi:hypothetical protein
LHPPTQRPAMDAAREIVLGESQRTPAGAQ